MTFKDCKNAGCCGKDLCLPEFCHQFEPIQKTNADRIREMTDEELGKFLCSLSECFSGRCPGSDICKPGNNGCCEWIRQPAAKEV